MKKEINTLDPSFLWKWLLAALIYPEEILSMMENVTEGEINWQIIPEIYKFRAVPCESYPISGIL